MRKRCPYDRSQRTVRVVSIVGTQWVVVAPHSAGSSVVSVVATLVSATGANKLLPCCLVTVLWGIVNCRVA
jgi:hypothetical protein